jgi:hypothetical protein
MSRFRLVSARLLKSYRGTADVKVVAQMNCGGIESVICCLEQDMIKEFLLCGIGMAADMSGSQFAASVPSLPPPQEAIGNYWKQVGLLLDYSIKAEGKKIEEVEARQLPLKLT